MFRRTLTVISLFAIGISWSPAIAKKVDKKVYSKFNLVQSDRTQIGSIHEAKKGKVLFSTPVEALEMVEITSSATFKSLGKTMGIAGPRNNYTIEQGTKFYKVYSAVYEHIYCEVGRYEYFDNCLIDTNGDSHFDLAANKSTSKGSPQNLVLFTPAKIAHKAELDNKVPYIQAHKRMPVEYNIIYLRGSKKPKFVSTFSNKKNKAASWYLQAPNYPKNKKNPYHFSIGEIELKILSVINKTVSVEIIKGPDSSEVLVPF